MFLIIPILQEYTKVVTSKLTSPDSPVSFMIPSSEPVQPVTLDTLSYLENVSKTNALLVNTKNTDNVSITLSDATSTTISPNATSAPSDTLSLTVSVTELHLTALEELSSTNPPLPAIKSTTNANNG
jgi:hypothetical protein